MERIEGLEVVARAGAPAQREEARRLTRVLEEYPEDALAQQAASALVEAYFHDPHLER